MKYGMKLFAATAFAIGLSAVSVSAATCSAMSNNQTVDYELIQSETPPSPDNVLMFACEDNANDTNTIDSSFEIFGHTGWILSDKSDGFSPEGPLTWAIGGDGFEGPQPGGSTWKVDGDLTGISAVFVTLKQKNSFAAFKLDLTEALEGTWSTSDIFGQGFDISHGSIYYKEGDPPVDFDIPVPAGLPLVLTGLGVMGVLRAKKRKQA